MQNAFNTASGVDTRIEDFNRNMRWVEANLGLLASGPSSYKMDANSRRMLQENERNYSMQKDEIGKEFKTPDARVFPQLDNVQRYIAEIEGVYRGAPIVDYSAKSREAYIKMNNYMDAGGYGAGGWDPDKARMIAAQQDAQKYMTPKDSGGIARSYNTPALRKLQQIDEHVTELKISMNEPVSPEEIQTIDGKIEQIERNVQNMATYMSSSSMGSSQDFSSAYNRAMKDYYREVNLIDGEYQTSSMHGWLKNREERLVEVTKLNEHMNDYIEQHYATPIEGEGAHIDKYNQRLSKLHDWKSENNKLVGDAHEQKALVDMNMPDDPNYVDQFLNGAEPNQAALVIAQGKHGDTTTGRDGWDRPVDMGIEENPTDGLSLDAPPSLPGASASDNAAPATAPSAPPPASAPSPAP